MLRLCTPLKDTFHVYQSALYIEILVECFECASCLL